MSRKCSICGNEYITAHCLSSFAKAVEWWKLTEEPDEANEIDESDREYICRRCILLNRIQTGEILDMMTTLYRGGSK